MDTLPAPKKAQGYVVVHGHFYQPPRENPWIEQIEVERSAHPYHDWNARIDAECYSPNGNARIYDGQHRILDITNNYAYLSFNFGPTLLSWLEVHAPITYRRILEADRLSHARLGHGNALAQAYNHAILPLANTRDRETQVIWGLKDFEKRFQRPAESLWLPETAVDYPTLGTLVEQGLKFIILSPYQAARVRPLTGGAWQQAQAHTLDTTQAYRCFLPGRAGSRRRHIDVFFYNGAAAADISFGGALQDSNRLAARLVETFSPDLPRPQILHAATDGENYGHHKKFGELALAHALKQVLPQQGFILSNYAAFLHQAPPQMEVELYLGPRGEGSSWSCAHGVGRWKEDCGCSTGGQPTWNQRWRTTLREAFDFLNRRLAVIFETQGQKYLADPWAARNGYIQVILDRSSENLADYFSRHGAPGLGQADWVPALKLLEMQRHAQLMYTSCGWFFADLAGLETLQVLKYAARALQLGQHFTSEPLEPPFLEILETARSNRSEEGTGRDLYQTRVRPAVVDFPKVMNQWAIARLKDRERQCPANIYHYHCEPRHYEDRTEGSLVFACGRLRLTSGITRESQTLAFFTIFMGTYLYRTQVLASADPQEFQTLQQAFFLALSRTPEDVIPLMARLLGDRYYTAQDMFLEEKQELFENLLEPTREDAVAQIAHNVIEARPLLKAMAAAGLPLPRLYRALGEITLNRRLVELLRELEPEPTRLPTSQEILDLVQEAKTLGLNLESGEGATILGRILDRHLRRLAERFEPETAENLQHFMNLVSRIPLTLEVAEAQNMLFRLMEERFAKVADQAPKDPQARTLARLLLDLAEALHISPVRYLRLLK